MIIELAKIISIMNVNDPSVADVGIPIMIIVVVGTIVVLADANSKSGTNRKSDPQS